MSFAAYRVTRWRHWPQAEPWRETLAGPFWWQDDITSEEQAARVGAIQLGADFFGKIGHVPPAGPGSDEHQGLGGLWLYTWNRKPALKRSRNPFSGMAFWEPGAWPARREIVVVTLADRLRWPQDVWVEALAGVESYVGTGPIETQAELRETVSPAKRNNAAAAALGFVGLAGAVLWAGAMAASPRRSEWR